jgi:hypothetical protein
MQAVPEFANGVPKRLTEIGQLGKPNGSGETLAIAGGAEGPGLLGHPVETDRYCKLMQGLAHRGDLLQQP